MNLFSTIPKCKALLTFLEWNVASMDSAPNDIRIAAEVPLHLWAKIKTQVAAKDTKKFHLQACMPTTADVGNTNIIMSGTRSCNFSPTLGVI